MSPEDLNLVIQRTGHTRYRELTDPEDSSYDPSYEELVRQEAARFRKEPYLPPTSVQIRNAMSAVGRAVQAVATGKPLYVSETVKAARLATCHSCDQYRHSDDRCGACGCWQDGLLGHAALATERCPLNRWRE